MFPQTVEGILFDTTDISSVLYVPVPFKPGVTTPTSIDDCMVEYWVPCIWHQGQAHELNLYRKTIKLTIENMNTTYTIHFTNQTKKLPVNKTVEEMAKGGSYSKWAGTILIIKSDKCGCPITCKGKDGFYIPEAMEQLVTITIVSKLKHVLIYWLRFFMTVVTKSPYKN